MKFRQACKGLENRHVKNRLSDSLTLTGHSLPIYSKNLLMSKGYCGVQEKRGVNRGIGIILVAVVTTARDYRITFSQSCSMG